MIIWVHIQSRWYTYQGLRNHTSSYLWMSTLFHKLELSFARAEHRYILILSSKRIEQLIDFESSLYEWSHGAMRYWNRCEMTHLSRRRVFWVRRDAGSVNTHIDLKLAWRCLRIFETS